MLCYCDLYYTSNVINKKLSLQDLLLFKHALKLIIKENIYRKCTIRKRILSCFLFDR